MWANESVFYQIFPLGFCGAPFENNGVLEHRILNVKEWIPHLSKLGVNAVYFSPIFESDTHGYNTKDYTKIDCRLGTNEDFKDVVTSLHNAGIKVVVDGVFNHVGRSFFAFQDVLQNREQSRYVSWFSRIDFNGSNPYNDGLWYEGWEGTELVKLNLYNDEVVNYLFSCIEGWIQEFDIDGIRLDVAYCLPNDFTQKLRRFTDSKKADFFLLGEVLHGEYGRILNEKGLHSVTNYQCYKGLYSAFNSANMFEIIHSLLRLFGPEEWCVARGAHLLSFVDNHDVTRIASILTDKNCLPLVYSLEFGMPGIPSIYYGSEWGAEGIKKPYEQEIRPCFEAPKWNTLTDHIKSLCYLKTHYNCLNYGNMKTYILTNKAVIFERAIEGERILVGMNMDSNPYTCSANFYTTKGIDLLTNETFDFTKEITMQPYTSYFWKV